MMTFQILKASRMYRSYINMDDPEWLRQSICEQPCKKAYLEEFVCGAPKKIDEKTLIRRVWCVDIDSLEELIELQKEVGNDLILQEKEDVDGLRALMVYDSYIE